MLSRCAQPNLQLCFKVSVLATRRVTSKRASQSRSPSCLMTTNRTARKPARLVVVGDVHNHWSERDALALKFLEPDVALFVGDFGEEVVQLVEAIKTQINACSIPAAYILGNHDAWYSLSKKLSGHDDPLLSGVQRQLRALGNDHVGYSSKHFPDIGLSVVGARPFSAGGASWARAARFQHIMYGINNMKESADKICATIRDQPAQDAVVVLAHNGPSGFGSQQHDICGKDWSDKAGDHGDPDLASALEDASASGRPVPLVVFGHMHHMLKGGRRSRNMVHIEADSRTVLLNCAVVPRWGTDPIAPNNPNACTSQFTVIEMAIGGYVQSASYVWVGTHGSQCCVVSEQKIIRTQSCTHNRLVRQFLVTGNISGVGNDKLYWETVVSVLPSS
ncbi:hypothetical protein ABBQ32_009668 [Trebouxia sp. C0010 RCD-2024]